MQPKQEDNQLFEEVPEDEFKPEYEEIPAEDSVSSIPDPEEDTEQFISSDTYQTNLQSEPEESHQEPLSIPDPMIESPSADPDSSPQDSALSNLLNAMLKLPMLIIKPSYNF